MKYKEYSKKYHEIRKEEKNLVSEELTMENILIRCLKIITGEKNLERAIGLLLEVVGGYYKADRAYIFEFDYENQIIDNTFEWYQPGMESKSERIKKVPMDWVDLWKERLYQEGEIFISSIEQHLDQSSALYRELKEDGVTAFTVVALRNEGKLEGILGIDNPKQEIGSLVLLHSVAEFICIEMERHHMIRELEYMSYTDSLTGLKNRNSYNKLLKEYEQKTPDSLGVILLDINGLKRINENHGDGYGDYMIRKVGIKFEALSQGNVFRIGGDEFVSLQENIMFEEFQEQVISIKQSFLEEKECMVSMGCIWEDKEENIRLILQKAEQRLAADKQSYYHTILREGRKDTYDGISAEVIREVEEGRFVIHYQPQVDIKTGKIMGAEALVRKREEDGTLISPNKFIPFYEVEGVVSHVDLFVMKSACLDMKKWKKQGHEIHMSINFSRVTLLEEGIVDILKEICFQCGISPSEITIEVTESISKMGHKQLKELITNINKAGFTISLDDFGSQYSNLSILSDMEFDEIKFDKSLVEELEYNPKSRIVMEHTVNMCRQLKRTSLAEGIETKGQLELLMGYNCNYGQGFYFSKPVPEEVFCNLLGEVIK